MPCDMQGDSKFLHRREKAGLVEGRDGGEEHAGLGDTEEMEMFLLACCDLPSGKELRARRGRLGLFPLVDLVSCLLNLQLYWLYYVASADLFICSSLFFLVEQLPCSLQFT